MGFWGKVFILKRKMQVKDPFHLLDCASQSIYLSVAISGFLLFLFLFFAFTIVLVICPVMGFWEQWKTKCK